jgi:hypothetical protein
MTTPENSEQGQPLAVPLERPVRPLTAKARRLVSELEAMGHRNVRVWWERIGMAMEMCGPSGGWFCESDMTHYQPEPLGLSFDAALHSVRHHSWLDFRHVPERPNAKLYGPGREEVR